VGTVFIALAHRAPNARSTQVRRFQFSGDRIMVRDRAAKSALQMLRFRLMQVDDSLPLLWQVPHPSRADQSSHRDRRTA
jgi:hypothetical protein